MPRRLHVPYSVHRPGTGLLLTPPLARPASSKAALPSQQAPGLRIATGLLALREISASATMTIPGEEGTTLYFLCDYPVPGSPVSIRRVGALTLLGASLLLLASVVGRDAPL
jgi:hypothetical protein